MVTVEEKMSDFCEKNQYWESIDSILVKYLGSEIQDIAYNDQLQVLLSLTDETIVFQYYQENPQEYCLWLIALRTEKFSVEVSYDAVFQWQNKPEDFIKYENALLNILELATPLKIGDSAEYGASIAQRAFPYWKTTQF